MNLNVIDIFYSIQGEGNHAGEASIFIRLAGCNQNCKYCDTDWQHGTIMTLTEILDKVKSMAGSCDRIIWTGGEPTEQLTAESIYFFNANGFLQSIETNGTNPVPFGIEYISCSPKISSTILRKNFADFEISEYRCLIGDDNGARTFPPPIDSLPLATHYYISPLFTGEENKKFDLDRDNLALAIDWVLKNPRWKLSIQQHKIWGMP